MVKGGILLSSGRGRQPKNLKKCFAGEKEEDFLARKENGSTLKRHNTPELGGVRMQRKGKRKTALKEMSIKKKSLIVAKGRKTIVETGWGAFP